MLAMMSVTATPDRVWRVLTSFEEMPSHLSALKQSRILKREGAHLLVEQIVKAGIPLLPITFRVILDVVDERPFLFFKQRLGSFAEFRGHWRVDSRSNGLGSRIQYFLELGMGRGLRRKTVEQQLYRTIRQTMEELLVWIENSGK